MLRWWLNCRCNMEHVACTLNVLRTGELFGLQGSCWIGAERGSGSGGGQSTGSFCLMDCSPTTRCVGQCCKGNNPDLAKWVPDEICNSTRVLEIHKMCKMPILVVGKPNSCNTKTWDMLLKRTSAHSHVSTVFTYSVPTPSSWSAGLAHIANSQMTADFHRWARIYCAYNHIYT